jgi:hypothetical protein
MKPGFLTFQRNLKDYVGRLEEKKTPLGLTVNGWAEVVQDAHSYQALLDRLEGAGTVALIRQGMEQFERVERILLKQAQHRLAQRLTADAQ